MVSSLEKLDFILQSSLDYSISASNETSSWPVFDTMEQFKPCYVRYSYIDLDYRKTLRRERLLKDRNDPFYQLTVDEVKRKYKFFPHTINDIVNLVGKDFQKHTHRNNPLTPKQSVCVALYCLGHGMVFYIIHPKSFDYNFNLGISSKSFFFASKSVC